MEVALYSSSHLIIIKITCICGKHDVRDLDPIQERLDGRIEWVCDHGVGHTVWYPKGSDAVHGCDGCCNDICRKAKIKK